MEAQAADRAGYLLGNLLMLASLLASAVAPKQRRVAIASMLMLLGALAFWFWVDPPFGVSREVQSAGTLATVLALPGCLIVWRVMAVRRSRARRNLPYARRDEV